MDERCVKEKCTNSKGELLTPDKVTLYDMNKYIIKPFTAKNIKLCVSSLPSTTGQQPPRFVIYHQWGETVNKFIECLEQASVDFSKNKKDKDD